MKTNTTANETTKKAAMYKLIRMQNHLIAKITTDTANDTVRALVELNRAFDRINSAR